MADSLTLHLILYGDFRDAKMADWVARHAAKLDLRGWVRAHSHRRIDLLISGNRVLVEAMEVACSLGPITARVVTIERREVTPPAGIYRQPGQFVTY